MPIILLIGFRGLYSLMANPGMWSKQLPGEARPRTQQEACTFGARLVNRSVFILDPRLDFAWNSWDACDKVHLRFWLILHHKKKTSPPPITQPSLAKWMIIWLLRGGGVVDQSQQHSWHYLIFGLSQIDTWSEPINRNISCIIIMIIILIINSNNNNNISLFSLSLLKRWHGHVCWRQSWTGRNSESAHLVAVASHSRLKECYQTWPLSFFFGLSWLSIDI